MIFFWWSPLRSCWASLFPRSIHWQRRLTFMIRDSLLITSKQACLKKDTWQCCVSNKSEQATRNRRFSWDMFYLKIKTCLMCSLVGTMMRINTEEDKEKYPFNLKEKVRNLSLNHSQTVTKSYTLINVILNINQKSG